MTNETKDKVMDAAANLFEVLYGDNISSDTRKKIYYSVIDFLDPLIEDAYKEDEKEETNKKYASYYTYQLPGCCNALISDNIDELYKVEEAARENVLKVGKCSVADLITYFDKYTGFNYPVRFTDYKYGFKDDNFIDIGKDPQSDGFYQMALDKSKLVEL